jgi:hypothetical protein
VKIAAKYNFTNEQLAEMTHAERQRYKRAEEDDFREHGVVIRDAGATDILRDIRWVYDNMSRLCIVTPLGNRILDVDFLRTAPSNGAVSMATYYRDDAKGFMKTYAVKLLPKDAKQDDDKATEDELLADMDPEFSTMERYLQNVKVPKGG